MFEIVGLPASPYSLKLRAILRYRRVPHVWTMLLPEASNRRFEVRPLMLPILCDTDGREQTDSTTIALGLEDRFPDGRSVLPVDPALRFLCLFIEDFCDEWLAKPMFHYRWSHAESAAMAGRWLANDLRPTGSEQERAALASAMIERQVGRLDLVGCRAGHAPLLEGDYRALLTTLSSHLGEAPYLFGTRPSLADFALFGHLSQLAIDPVSRRIMEAEAQDVADWVRRTDDLSGWTGDWDDAAPERPVISALLTMAGDRYLPYLSANERALAAGQSEIVATIGGTEFRQPVFPFHRKCAARLRALHAALDEGTKVSLREILRRTNVLDWLAETS
jgi:glutathione S-transferase